MALATIWVLAESDDDGQVTSLTKELLTKARELADTVEAFVAGDASGMAETLGAFGATTVHATGALEGSLTGVPAAAAIAALVEAGNGPDLLIGGTTYDARDTVASLSVRLDAPVLTNCTDIELDGDAIVVTEPIFGGTKLVKTKFATDKLPIALLRPKSFPAEESGGGAASVNEVSVPDAGAAGGAKVLNTHVEEREGPQLEDAAVVVSGGRGLGDPSKFDEYIEKLGKQLGAATGATRAIVDAGWVPYAKQVGQTGKVVKPGLYIAAGISGATQHLVGMKGAANIIAINKDPEAPIFSVADLGIVGDVHKVLPALIEALENR